MPFTPEEAWGLVAAVLKNSAYESAAEFKRLPEQIRRFVGSPSKQREHRQANKEELDQQREHRQANKEEIAAQQREHRQANKEELAAKQRAYYEANKEEIAAQKRAYYEANKEKQLDAQHRWLDANRERLNAYMREYRARKAREKV